MPAQLDHACTGPKEALSAAERSPCSRRLADVAGAGAQTHGGRRYAEDVDCAAALGCNSLRLSLEWARIEPRQGEIDQQAVARYHQILDRMEARGLEPLLVLHHFVHPGAPPARARGAADQGRAARRGRGRVSWLAGRGMMRRHSAWLLAGSLTRLCRPRAVRLVRGPGRLGGSG
jgi:hypothetical protein